MTHGSEYVSDEGKPHIGKNALALSKQGFDLMDKKKYPDPGTDGVDLRGFRISRTRSMRHFPMPTRHCRKPTSRWESIR